MSQFQDLTGMAFGRLEVIELIGEKLVGRWLCLCKCGKKKIICGSNLRSGYTQSCGCLQKERASKANTTHGKRYTPEFKVWCGMRQRCSNPNAPHFSCYGGRGIKVCKRWSSFENFMADMGPRPSSKHSIERKKNAGDYRPSNCRWATRKEQMRNRRTNHLLTINGQTKTMAEWVERYGQDYRLVRIRITRLKWSALKALTTPVRRKDTQHES